MPQENFRKTENLETFEYMHLIRKNHEEPDLISHKDFVKIKKVGRELNMLLRKRCIFCFCHSS